MKKTMSSTNSAKKMFKPPEELKSYGSNVASIMQTEEVLDEGEITPNKCRERSPLLISEF